MTSSTSRVAVRLAHSARDLSIEILFAAAASFNLSSNFSQIRGTAKNKVGLAQCKVSTRLPYKASDLAKKT